MFETTHQLLTSVTQGPSSSEPVPPWSETRDVGASAVRVQPLQVLRSAVPTWSLHGPPTVPTLRSQDPKIVPSKCLGKPSQGASSTCLTPASLGQPSLCSADLVTFLFAIHGIHKNKETKVKINTNKLTKLQNKTLH